MRSWPDFAHYRLPEDVQAHIDWLEAQVLAQEGGIDEAFATGLQSAYRLTHTQARFVGLIAARDVLTKDMAMAALYGDVADPPDDKILAVMICHIRKAIDFRIDTVWGLGWQMAPETRAQLKARFAGARAA